MKRRSFLALAGAAAAFPRIAVAQSARMPRLAWLSSSTSQPTEFVAAGTDRRALLDRLAELGHVDGKTVAIDYFLAPSVDDVPVFAARAVAANPNVILCSTTPAALAAKNATNTISIVMIQLNDPVASGLVMSLSRPGGNITGNTQTAPDVVGKQLALIRELLPAMRRLGVLTLPADPSHALILAQLRPAAQALGIEPVPFEFVEAQDFDAQLERVEHADVQAFTTLSSQYFVPRNQALSDFQIRTGIVRQTGTTPPWLGVIGYGPSTTALHRQAAEYVDAILKGTKPADLPVQQPTVFDLIVNLKIAKAMGLAIPPSVYAQATIVVE